MFFLLLLELHCGLFPFLCAYCNYLHSHAYCLILTNSSKVDWLLLQLFLLACKSTVKVVYLLNSTHKCRRLRFRVRMTNPSAHGWRSLALIKGNIIVHSVLKKNQYLYYKVRCVLFCLSVTTLKNAN